MNKHQVVHPGGVDFLEHGIGQRLAEIDPVDECADAGGQGFDFYVAVCRCHSFALSQGWQTVATS